MKRVISVFLLLLLLPGCGKPVREMERAMALRARLLAAEGCGFDAQITADYGDKVYSFSMTCVGNADGSLNFTVSSPETIAGITGTASEEGGNLTFDDTVLQFELMTDEQLSPVSAPWIFWKTLREGYLTSAGMEEGMLRLCIDDSYEDDALHLDIWLNEGDMPVRCEILYDGSRILTLAVTNFDIR